ncbi:MAG TPA: hypothetical protein VFP68_05695 [Burkholderiaceae bacterium]|nr:hypothetical protein [Burkholderiaceae bacterium]
MQAVLVSALLAAASGCAAPSSPSNPLRWRLQVRTAEDWTDLAQLAERASQIAGVPVEPDVSTIAPHWYAITLLCPDRSSCKRASMKLAAQRSLFLELRRDEVRRIPSTPTAETRQ